MFPLMFAAIGGGIATATAVAPFGVVLGVLAAPVGGSLCAILAAVHLARRRGSDWQSQADLDDQADAMVTALRELTARAEQQGEKSEVSVLKPNAGKDGVRAA